MKKSLGFILGVALTGVSLVSCTSLDKELKIGDLIPKPKGAICKEEIYIGKMLARGFCDNHGELIRTEVYGENGEVVQNIFYGPNGKIYVDGLNGSKNDIKANGKIDGIHE